MRARLLLLTTAVAVLAGACNSTLGADDPECADVDEVSNSIIMEAQSVPTAFYGPCIEELRVGWSIQPLRAQSGRSSFALDSDRIGTGFLEVTLQAVCDVGAARETDSGVEDVRLHQSVEQAPSDVEFAVLPVADRHARYSEDFAFSLRARGYTVVVMGADQTLGERMELATEEGRSALVVDDIDLENGTASLRVAGSRDEIPDVTLDEVLARFELSAEEESYRSTWFYTFEGGCITYEFDAEGPGAAALPEEIPAALGFFQLEALRDSARRAGFEI